MQDFSVVLPYGASLIRGLLPLVSREFELCVREAYAFQVDALVCGSISGEEFLVRVTELQVRVRREVRAPRGVLPNLPGRV